MIRWGWPVVVVVLLSVAGCGDDAPPTAEQRERALAAGFEADLAYVTDADGYNMAAGGSGVYGDSGYQGIYSSARGEVLRLTVERTSLDAATCPDLPIPGAESVVPVQCTPDGDAWVRVAGAEHEYAIARGDRLVRVSGPDAATVRSVAVAARPATGEELEALLPARSSVVERGDIHGDNAPDNDVGAGG